MVCQTGDARLRRGGCRANEMKAIERNPLTPGWLPCRAQVVLAAVQSPLLGDTKHASVLVPRLCSCILMAPQHCRHVSALPSLHNIPSKLHVQPSRETCLHVRTI